MSRYRRASAGSPAATAILAGSLGGGGAVAQDQVEFDFYDIHHVDPGQTFIDGRRRRIHGGPPERQDQRHVPRERAAQGQGRDRDAVGQPARPVPGAGAAARSPSRSTPAWSGRSTTRSRMSRTRSTRRGLSMTHVDGKQYGLPYNLGVVGLWYNKDLFAAGRHRRAPRDVGGAAHRRPDVQGRGHRPDLRSRPGPRTPGPRCSGSPTSRHASAVRRA